MHLVSNLVDLGIALVLIQTECQWAQLEAAEVRQQLAALLALVAQVERLVVAVAVVEHRKTV